MGHGCVTPYEVMDGASGLCSHHIILVPISIDLCNNASLHLLISASSRDSQKVSIELVSLPSNLPFCLINTIRDRTLPVN